ncbi:MAG: hypothetical protein KC613_05205 [Myxococcales bacterium]|nr:hypothetical protein [Myxococcales bacterium]MCB9523776.1 hypothetical protein [Myxococcales bacterium]
MSHRGHLSHRVASTSGAVLALLLAGGAWAQPESEAPPPNLDFDNPATCAPCHAAVVAEWTRSMHAQAHHSKDPVYAGLRAVRMAKEGAAVAQGCDTCHAPRAAGPDDLSPAATNGVSCATCHTTAHVKAQGQGAARLVPFEDPKMIQGPNKARPGMVAPHGLGGDPPPHFVDGMSLCLACHEQLVSPKGVTLCNTGHEFGGLGGAFPDQRCIDCHMPIIEGPSGTVDRDQAHASHSFVGPHHRWTPAEQGATPPQPVEVEAAFDGGLLRVVLKNGAGHGWPSGFPARLALVKLVGLDAGGQPVWTNFKDDPLAESPESVLNAVFVDAAGKPTLPPFSVAKQRENRLRPGEARTVTYAVPAAVKAVKGKVLYRLVPPPAVKLFKLEGLPEAEPRPVIDFEVAR